MCIVCISVCAFKHPPFPIPSPISSPESKRQSKHRIFRITTESVWVFKTHLYADRHSHSSSSLPRSFMNIVSLPCLFFSFLSLPLSHIYGFRLHVFLSSQTQSIQTQPIPAPLPPHHAQLKIPLLARRRSTTDIPLLLPQDIPEAFTTAITAPPRGVSPCSCALCLAFRAC